jgi:hypothetical protein
MASRTISRGCTSTWLRVPEKDGYVSAPGSDYLKDHHKDLALNIGQLALQEFTRHRWRQDRSSFSRRTL